MRLKDCSDGARELLLDCEYIFQFAIVIFGPPVASITAVDELCGDTDSIAPAANAALKHVPYSQLPADLANIHRLPLYLKLELRAMTNSCRNRDNAVMMSSTMPSLKYSCSGSSLIFWNGSTAIEGLSGSGKAGREGGPAAPLSRTQ